MTGRDQRIAEYCILVRRQLPRKGILIPKACSVAAVHVIEHGIYHGFLPPWVDLSSLEFMRALYELLEEFEEAGVIRDLILRRREKPNAVLWMSTRATKRKSVM